MGKILFLNKKIKGFSNYNNVICKKILGLNLRKNPKNLKVDHYRKLDTFIDVKLTDTVLQKKIKSDINFLKQIRSFHGDRHRAKLPCRGQRTHTNSRTVRRLRSF